MGVTRFGAEKPSLAIKKNIRFSSKNKNFNYWSKENEKEIPIKMPLKFLIVAQTSKIGGFSTTHEKFMYSSEVGSIKTDKLFVQCNGQMIAQGVYNDIKEQVKADGGKYCKVLYISLNGELCKLEVIGASLSSFIEAKMKCRGWIEVSELGEGKKGSNTYNFPIFKELTEEIKVDEYDKACGLGMDVDEHFKATKKWFADQRDEVSEDAESILNDNAEPLESIQAKGEKLSPPDLEAKLKETGDAFAKKQKEEDGLPF